MLRHLSSPSQRRTAPRCAVLRATPAMQALFHVPFLTRWLLTEAVGPESIGAVEDWSTMQEGSRYGARMRQPEFAKQLADALSEGGLERFGAPFVKAASDMKRIVAELAQIVENNTVSFDRLKDALTAMDAPPRTLIGLLTALGSSSQIGQGLGLALLGSGVGEGFVQRYGRNIDDEGTVPSGIGRFHLLPLGVVPWICERLGSGPSLNPQRPGP